MSIAALCLGIGSFVLAAMMTAPFFFLLAFVGVPLALVGLVVSVLAFVQLFRSRLARRPIEPGSFSHAGWGLGLCLIALAWQGVLVKLWVDLTM